MTIWGSPQSPLPTGFHGSSSMGGAAVSHVAIPASPLLAQSVSWALPFSVHCFSGVIPDVGSPLQPQLMPLYSYSPWKASLRAPEMAASQETVFGELVIIMASTPANEALDF